MITPRFFSLLTPAANGSLNFTFPVVHLLPYFQLYSPLLFTRFVDFLDSTQQRSSMFSPSVATLTRTSDKTLSCRCTFPRLRQCLWSFRSFAPYRQLGCATKIFQCITPRLRLSLLPPVATTPAEFQNTSPYKRSVAPKTTC